MDEEDEISQEMVGKLDTFQEALNNLDATLKPFLKIPVNDTNEKIDDPLMKARLDLMVAYSINSLFWGYLGTQGINSKNHPIRNELKRVQEYMAKVKLAEEKKKMARVDTHAAKRFIRNALWEKPNSSKDVIEEDREGDESNKNEEISKNDDSDEAEQDRFSKKSGSNLNDDGIEDDDRDNNSEMMGERPKKRIKLGDGKAVAVETSKKPKKKKKKKKKETQEED